MTREDIIVPRWFLEIIEDTLRIQYNINKPDMKETGESCQDRNIRQCLNGTRKLLSGEELTGMERQEKLQPSLPEGLDEAAEKSAALYYADGGYSPFPNIETAAHKAGFIAGVEWERSYSPWLSIPNLEEASIEFGEQAKMYEIGGQTFSEDMAVAFTRGAEWLAKKMDDEAYEEVVQEVYQDEYGIHCSVSVGMDYNPGDIVLVNTRKK